MCLTPSSSVPLKAENVSLEAESTLNVDAFFPEMAAVLVEVSEGQENFILATVPHDPKGEGSCSLTETACWKS